MDTRHSRYTFRVARIATLSVALMFYVSAIWSQTPTGCLASGTTVTAIDMKVLVIAADGAEPGFAAIKSTLEHIGVPYDELIASETLLTQDRLCSITGTSGRGHYQGVLLTTGNLGFLNPSTGNWESALTTEEWTRLWQYEAQYRVRQVTLYTYPAGLPDNYGLTLQTGIDTSSTPLATTLTTTRPAGSGNPTGRQAFSYLNVNNPVTIQYAWTYLATPTATVTPLLVTSAGEAIVSINNYPDGRKNLTITADGNPSLLHTLALGYGIINWVTKGLYVGQRKIYLSAQPDDVLIANDMWSPRFLTDVCTIERQQANPPDPCIYRMTADDFNKLMAWQSNLNASTPNAAGIKLEIPFNGFGTSPEYPPEDLYPATSDGLTPAVSANEDTFTWISHTYTHPNLDSPVTYATTLSELRQNHTVANGVIRMTQYQKDGLVTPQISGLNNPAALRAMKDFGVRYVVSDTSKFCGNRDEARQLSLGCPKPNTGIYNDLRPEILMIPRYPSNLFYNVRTPEEWASEYNHIYRTFWGRDLSYQEILDKESEIWLRYLLRFDMRPVMFHQPNIATYDGGRSLLGDLIETTLAKYNAILNLPVLSRRQRQVGNLMAERMTLNGAIKPATGAALTARIIPGTTTGLPSSIALSNPTSKAVVVPITGVNWTGATSRETYGQQTTSKVTVGANGGAVTVPGAPAW